MNIPTQEETVKFASKIEGNLGHFATPAGNVVFLQTRARLAQGDTSNAGRLTALLTPAREALDIREMDFNQLLQRDLDDHRIAHDLVPYILRQKATGPAFFPPILTALLPFQNRKPVNEFPGVQVEGSFSDIEYGKSIWRAETAGEVFRLQQLLNQDGSLDQAGYGVLRWNDEKAKLIIMDGQHRAMALLAIYRTITNTWSSGSAAGEKYKPFYETKVKEFYGGLIGDSDKFQPIEFPVTICLFPEYTGKGKNPHLAARKLFVDVNKEAKPPSESRLILLSDVRLDHILARELLNRLRSNGSNIEIPLFAVEYDNPQPRSSTPRRWSAVTNLEILLKSVRYVCFGPSEIVADIAKVTSVSGKPNLRAMGSYFRKQMNLKDSISSEFSDGPRHLDRQELGIDVFPIYNQEARQAILERFFEEWGHGILRLFGEILPYRAHVDAIRSMYSNWGPSGAMESSLAKEALFEGVGMYWTLEQGYRHWVDQCKKARQSGNTPPEKNDICKAWEVVDDSRKASFEIERTRQYMQSTKEGIIAETHQFYEIAITYAAQVGLVLTWALLKDQNPKSNSDNILDAMISGINRSLETGPVKSRDRRLILSKGQKNAFNMLPRLDAKHAAYFRVFWLELLLVEENQEELDKADVDVDLAKETLNQGRAFYLDVVVNQRADDLKGLHPDWGPERCAKEARRAAIKELVKAYDWWFGYSTTEMFDVLMALREKTLEGAMADSTEDEDSGVEESE